MPHIQQLSPHVADLIAAGEVVERPASVVKELVENAIDAGASAVVVEIQNGGMSLIRVTDNGCGIAPEELPTAFLRHATSKLRQAGDLAAIGTLGFRGEALAAISAVSRVEIFSRTAGAPLGASLSLVGGAPGLIESAGCPEGTTIVVRDLFYNTPARLKFMKSDSAEASAVGGMLGQIALSRPEVSIQYIRDGREELHTPGDGKLLSAIYAARGRDFALRLVEVEGGEGAAGRLPDAGDGGQGVRIRGFVTEPLAGRGSRAMQTFFCCGRLIKSALLTAALEEAYANRQMKGKFPGCVLHVDLPRYQVDVNVHPAKTVVKFANERAVFSALHHTVQDALDRAGRPETLPAIPPAPAVPQDPAPAQPPAQRGDFYRTMDARTFRESLEEREKPRGGGAYELPGGDSRSWLTFDTAVKRGMPAGRRETVAPEGGSAGRTADRPSPAKDRQRPRQTAGPGNPAPPHARQVPEAPDSPEIPASPDVPEEGGQTALTAGAAPWRMAGEILNTYIVAEDGDNVWLIDKHAAHERINFDRLKAGAEPIMRQQLLAPAEVALSREQCGVLLENLALLEEFGFEAGDAGGGSLTVRAVPADWDASLAAEALEMLADRLLTGGGADPAAARDAMLHTMACKASIKGGWHSDPAELRVLVDRVQSGEIQFCPHGRPVKVKISKYEIEKMFKRA